MSVIWSYIFILQPGSTINKCIFISMKIEVLIAFAGSISKFAFFQDCNKMHRLELAHRKKFSTTKGMYEYVSVTSLCVYTYV